MRRYGIIKIISVNLIITKVTFIYYLLVQGIIVQMLPRCCPEAAAVVTPNRYSVNLSRKKYPCRGSFTRRLSDKFIFKKIRKVISKAEVGELLFMSISLNISGKVWTSKKMINKSYNCIQQ